MPSAAALVASGIAQVKEPRPVEAKSIHPSDVTGTAYYVVRLSDYQLEATMATGDATAPVRFVGSLVPGQTVTISVPGEIGAPSAQIDFSRVGDQVIAATSKKVALAN
jgi:hypothetical protein